MVESKDKKKQGEKEKALHSFVTIASEGIECHRQFKALCLINGWTYKEGLEKALKMFIESNKVQELIVMAAIYVKAKPVAELQLVTMERIIYESV